jgi:GH24 family phage-related lysozyme (muramidase)
MNYEILKKEIMADEGYSNKIYLDHLGYPTVGIGHLIKKDDPEYGPKNLGKFITDERITELFTIDADTAVKDCKKLFPNFDTIPEDIQHVLVNMMFNLGFTRFSKFKNFKAAIEKKDWKKAATEGQDSLWYNQVPNRARRLMERLRNGK